MLIFFRVGRLNGRNFYTWNDDKSIMIFEGSNKMEAKICQKFISGLLRTPFSLLYGIFWNIY